jgi:hypothetical protein
MNCIIVCGFQIEVSMRVFLLAAVCAASMAVAACDSCEKPGQNFWWMTRLVPAQPNVPTTGTGAVYNPNILAATPATPAAPAAQ